MFSLNCTKTTFERFIRGGGKLSCKEVLDGTNKALLEFVGTIP